MELTKEYFDEQLGKLVTKEDFNQNLSNLVTKDYFQEHLEQHITPMKEDIRFLKVEVAEIKETVTRIDTRDLADSNALAKSFVDQDLKLKVLESDIKEIKEKIN